MSLNRAVALLLLVALAGCLGGAPADTDNSTTPATTTTQSPTSDTTTTTTEPHTFEGTSHHARHLTVRAQFDAENVTVTLVPNGSTATYEVPSGDERSFTREIHDRGHDVRVVVERGDDIVFEQTIYGYQYYEVTVRENDTSVTQSVV